MTPTQPLPLHIPRRVAGVDVARAVATAGMLLVNFRYATGAELNAPRWLKGLVSLIDGRASAAFVVLAGVSITLLARGVDAEADSPHHARRAIRRLLLSRGGVLFLIGLAHAALWPPDILHFYGLYLPLSLWTLRRSGLGIALGIAAVNLAFNTLYLALDYEAGWSESVLDSGELWTPIGFVRDTLFNGYHALLPWLSFVWLGVWLGRLDWSRPATRRALLACGLWGLLLAEVGGKLLLHLLPESTYIRHYRLWDMILSTDPFPPTPLYVFNAACGAVALIGLCAELAQRWPRAPWLRLLQATGQLSFTLYIAHTTLGLAMLRALGWMDAPPLAWSCAAAAAFYAASLLFAWAWGLRLRRRGPLEALMRWLTPHPRRR